MHKKLEAELVSLANSILQMNNKEDIDILHEKVRDIYEKLSVLKFVEDNIAAQSEVEQVVDEPTEQTEAVQEESVHMEENVIERDIDEDIEVESEPEAHIELESFSQEAQEPEVGEEIIEEPVVDIEEEIQSEILIDASSSDTTEPVDSQNQISLEEELQNAYSSDEATQLFEKVTKENPVIEEEQPAKQKSLNDALFKNNIQIGLNDRIAFVKHLFDGSQEDFNRVLSQLNSFKTEKESKHFINKLVKPDYDWIGKEEFEQRLLDLVERKFL